MKVFMYNKEEAIKNNCYTDKDPNTKIRMVIIYISLAFCIALFGPVFLLLIGLGDLLDFLWPIIWVGTITYIIYCIYNLIKWLSKYEYAKQISVIKEGDNYWAVKLTFIPEIGSAVNINTSTSILSSVDNVDKSETNKKLQEELNKNREIADVYIKVFNEARKENAPFIKDIDKNFNKIYNGNCSIVRLINVRLKKETKDSYIYYYEDANGKSKTIEFIKAYPDLKEEIK